MNRPVYLLCMKKKSESDGYGGHFSEMMKRAYEDQEQAFECVRNIIRNEGGEDVHWHFLFEDMHNDEIKILGKGKLTFHDGPKKDKKMDGEIRVGLYRICLISGKEEVEANG